MRNALLLLSRLLSVRSTRLTGLLSERLVLQALLRLFLMKNLRRLGGLQLLSRFSIMLVLRLLLITLELVLDGAHLLLEFVKGSVHLGLVVSTVLIHELGNLGLLGHG